MIPEFLQKASTEIRLQDGSSGYEQGLRLHRQWNGPECTCDLFHGGDKTVNIREVVLFSGAFPFAGDTPIYGEGFQMLSQYGGTIIHPSDIGPHSDRHHYKIPQVPGAFTVYSLLLLSPAAQAQVLLAFSSCRRFSGEFRLFPDGRFEVVLDAENLTLEPGAHWELEQFVALSGLPREALLADLAERIAVHHPPLPVGPIPTGWCSWYCYYADVTEDDILRNLDAIARAGLGLKYIQIDDGYQRRMGDWLAPNDRFPSGLRTFWRNLKAREYEPAIWVAPFIAAKDSEVFRQHPDWFIADDEGAPLPSSQVSFGGWRCGPWYALDGTHPQAQAHLENIFRTMREDWGCTYFKLDAIFWGTLHGGRLHDPHATRIEAYRRGMEAIRRGAGDAFLLGCNAPMWASFGLVHGMRVTKDIKRNWESFQHVARELFHRNWQNRKLWINDPDCLVLHDLKDQHASDDEYLFHATMIFASGGMILSGDNLTALPQRKQQTLTKLLPPIGVAARFDDTRFQVGRIDLADRQMVCVFNWTDSPFAVTIPLDGRYQVTDFWNDIDLGTHMGSFAVKNVPPHSAHLLSCFHSQNRNDRGGG